MSTHRYIDRICCAVLAVVLLLAILFVNGEKLGIQPTSSSAEYESRLFDTSKVHTIDLVMEDWDSFLDTCENEEYSVCTVVVDGETYTNVGIRAKGNTSLSMVSSSGSDRYSFKLEFDHYDSTKSYYGLDKISLNNIIQDNTYLKDYLTYQMMGDFGTASPLCSYVYITVNGEDWGLYLAVEAVEESFLERNYGSDYGELYKPDSMDMGGGRGNGEEFRMEDLNTDSSEQEPVQPSEPSQEDGNEDLPQGGPPNDAGDGSASPGTGEQPQAGGFGGGRGGGMMMGSDDVSLVYTDDSYESYSNIFDNAKTEITDVDKDRLIAALKNLNENQELEETVEIQQVIRYFVVHNFVCNFDSYTGSMIHNYYLYEEDGKLSMIPWDYNLAFGGFMSETDATTLVNYPIDTPVSGGTVDSRPMLAWIFSNEEYTQLYHEYFSEFLSLYFDEGKLTEMIDQAVSLISPYVEQDPTKFCTYEEFEQGVSTLKEFCQLRAQSIAGQLNGTIPATSDGQQADSSALVDAADLEISAMGSMGNTMGAGMGEPGGRGEGPDAGNMFPDRGTSGGQQPEEPPGTVGMPEEQGALPGEAPVQQVPDDSPPVEEQSTSSEASSDQQQAPDRAASQEAGYGGDSAPFGSFEPPAENQPDQAALQSAGQLSSGQWMLLGACFLLLAGGLCFAFLYRR